MDNKPTFAERTADLKAAAELLRTHSRALMTVAETVMTEVLHMEAAAQRFQQRGNKRRNTPAPTR
jgi:hypothetical protein